MSSYLKNVINTRETPQTEPVFGEKQVENNAGGYVYQLDKFQQLERWILLGSENGTYYAGEREHTEQNVKCLTACLEADPYRVIKMVVDISAGGRAPKNDQALFALAVAASVGARQQETKHPGFEDKAKLAKWEQGIQNGQVRAAALEALPHVARMGTHLYQFVEYVSKMRGWGPALKKAISRWFLDQPDGRLAYQLAKYQQREGWSSADVIRLAHPKPVNATAARALRWAVKGWDLESTEAKALAGAYAADLAPIRGLELAKHATDKNEIVRLITDYRLTREMIPTQWLNEPEVWDALLARMPLTAMIRNLGKMSNVGLLKPLSQAALAIQARLKHEGQLRMARVHPVQVLMALCVYQKGQGVKGSLTWTPVPQVIDALNEAFYLSFQNAPATGKRIYLAVDGSGSMQGGTVAGTFLNTAQGAAAMAMAVAHREENYYLAGYTDKLKPISVSKSSRLDEVARMFSIAPESTDCSVPIRHAYMDNLQVDAFVNITDNETWHGAIHPYQALQKYRDKTGIPAKLIVVGMTATNFTIGQAGDAGTLDVVGFDTQVPNLIADFIAPGSTKAEPGDVEQENQTT